MPHGLANAITLPYVLDFLQDRPKVQARLADLALAIGPGDKSESPTTLARRFVERVRALNATVGIPERIAALRGDDVPEIARAAIVEAHRDYPVPKNMSLPEAQALLRRML